MVRLKGSTTKSWSSVSTRADPERSQLADQRIDVVPRLVPGQDADVPRLNAIVLHPPGRHLGQMLRFPVVVSVEENATLPVPITPVVRRLRRRRAGFDCGNERFLNADKVWGGPVVHHQVSGLGLEVTSVEFEDVFNRPGPHHNALL